MSFFSKIFGGLFGGGSKQQAPPPMKAPDYQSLWKTYSGELQNINVNANRSIADVRARLSAAGASPDAIKMQTEFLETQRQNKIGSLEAGPTYATLKEGFEIAGGKRTNPYASAQVAPGEGANLLSYYTTLYGKPELPSDAGAGARKGASGASGGAGGAAEAGVTANPAAQAEEIAQRAYMEGGTVSQFNQKTQQWELVKPKPTGRNYEPSFAEDVKGAAKIGASLWNNLTSDKYW